MVGGPPSPPFSTRGPADDPTHPSGMGGRPPRGSPRRGRCCRSWSRWFSPGRPAPSQSDRTGRTQHDRARSRLVRRWADEHVALARRGQSPGRLQCPTHPALCFPHERERFERHLITRELARRHVGSVRVVWTEADEALVEANHIVGAVIAARCATHLAEDLTQETLVRVASTRPRLADLPFAPTPPSPPATPSPPTSAPKASPDVTRADLSTLAPPTNPNRSLWPRGNRCHRRRPRAA